MWIKRFAVKNVCQHADLDLELPRGLIGVFGPNGSGKSNLVNLMYAAVTNDFGRFFGLKVDCIRDLADDRAESHVTLEGEHHGVEFWLRRGLRPAGHELVIRGEKAITNERKIRERLESLLGVDARTFDLFVFKEQNRIYDCLFATDGERRKAFQTLCGTEECEEIWGLLGTTLSKDAEINAVVEDNSDELAGRLAQLELAREALVDARKRWQGSLMNEASLKTAESLVVDAQRIADLNAQMEREVKRLPGLQKAKADADLRLARRDRKTRGLVAQLKRSGPVADGARAALKYWRAYEVREARAEELRAAVARLEKKRASLRPPSPEPWMKGFDKDKTAEARAAALAELERLRSSLEILDRSGLSECPTCGTPVARLAIDIEQRKASVADLRAAAASCRSRLDAFAAYRQAKEEYERVEDRLSTAIKAHKEELSTYADHDAPTGDRAELAGRVAEHDELAAAVDASKAVLERRGRARAEAAAALSACERRMHEIEGDLEAIDVAYVEEHIERARVRLDEHRAAAAVIAKLDGQEEGLLQNIDAVKDELKRLRIRIRRGRRLRQMVAILERAREVVHRSNLPGKVARIMLGRLEGAINRDLALFGDPFWVETNEDLTFTAHQPGRPPEPAGRLSVGQRVILALPFWFAWKSEIGMLCLDEPTANLDADNQAYLAAALKTMAAAVRGSRQVIMVTHADSLRPAFDAVIDLGRAG